MANYDGNPSLYEGMDLNNTKKQVSEESSDCDTVISKANTCASSATTENKCNICEALFKITQCPGKIEWVDGHGCTFVKAPNHCPDNCFTIIPSPAGPKKIIDKTKCSGWGASNQWACCMTTDNKEWKCSGTKPDYSKYKSSGCPKNDTWISCIY